MGKKTAIGYPEDDDMGLSDLAAPIGQSADEARKGMNRLAKAIEDRGLVDDDMLKIAMSKLNNESAVSLKHSLIAMNLVTEEDILDAVASDMGMQRVDLSTVEFTPELLDEITPDVAKRYEVIPIKSDEDELWLALSDPSNVQAIDDLSRVLGKRIYGMIAGEEELQKAIRKYYEADEYHDMYEELSESENPGDQYDDDQLAVSQEATGDESPLVVRYVDMMFKQAVHDRASDIHIEPTRNGLIIRIRVDGVLQEIPSPPKAWVNAIIGRLKVLAGMDLAEKRVPLDGRIKLNIPGRKLDLRVSSLPTIFGESIVMRILDQSSVIMGLEDVGFLPDNVKLFNNLIKTPNGVILMTGPTGSGKTTTLYAALGVLNTPEHKLMTLEDPIEYMISGINQVQINAEIGLNFPMGLRALLRQSPDVILVGEIRDMETAENAIRAALTGHLVFSTLHTNDAPSAATRLVDMNVKPYLVASSVQAIIAQRLVRRICGNCKHSYIPEPSEFGLVGFNPEEYEGVEFFKGKGCERCNHSGSRGRTAIHEIMVSSSEIRRRIIRNEAATRLKRFAVTQGMRTLRMDGFEKCLLGQTTFEEVYKNVGNED